MPEIARRLADCWFLMLNRKEFDFFSIPLNPMIFAKHRNALLRWLSALKRRKGTVLGQKCAADVKKG
ncbi:hypothetical protein TSMEX_005071 [Taenia solium]|eukprot:TsM_001023100 transcript=TsM_001023100 gene=TsM_001023100